MPHFHCRTWLCCRKTAGVPTIAEKYARQHRWCKPHPNCIPGEDAKALRGDGAPLRNMQAPPNQLVACRHA